MRAMTRSNTPMTWTIRLLVLALVGMSLVWTVGRHVAAAQTTYYVDCSAGNDGNSGTSTGSAWRNINRANNASLSPGDKLLLKRGCTWSQQLKANWNGTASDPIIIGAYGSGDLPTVQNSIDGNVRIGGSYMTIENLKVYNSPSSYGSYDPNCLGQPVGWVVGFNFAGAHHVTVQNSVATHEAIGVALTQDAHNNHILNNQIVNNDGAWKPVSSPEGIRGGTGINLLGTGNEIAYNHFEGNNTHCRNESISIELYKASNSNIHHNVAFGDGNFVETGSTSQFQSADNTIAYNVYQTGMPNSRFLVTRGSGDSFGPVWRTNVYNNSVYLTGLNSQGIVCSSCGPNILRMQNNIIVAVAKALYIGAGQSIVESNNIFWAPSGNPPKYNFVQNWNMSSTSHLEDPKFANPGGRDFHLQSSSPAINAGTMDSVKAGYNSDVDGTSVPQAGSVDIGAYETGGSNTSNNNPTPTPTPTTQPAQQSTSATTLPGRVESENYNNGGEGVGYHDTTAQNIGGQYRQDGVDIQECSDPATANGQTCYNVGWPDTGEWLAYDVNVSAAGSYQANVRVASIYGDRHFHLEVDGKNVTGSVTVPNTGGWQNWTTVSTAAFDLSAGAHTMKFVDETNGLNVDFFEVVTASSASQSAGTANAVPGRVQAEDFNGGGEGVGYHDNTQLNIGGQYRQGGVDIQKCTDPTTPNGDTCYNVGWPDTGEWLAYDVNVSSAGNYKIVARVASIYGSAKFHFEVDGQNVTGSVTVPNTGGWQQWQTVTTPSFSLSAGSHTIKLVDETKGFNINYFDLTS